MRLSINYKRKKFQIFTIEQKLFILLSTCFYSGYIFYDAHTNCTFYKIHPKFQISKLNSTLSVQIVEISFAHVERHFSSIVLNYYIIK